MRPFFCYYGGKYRVAPKYDAPRFDTIIEPFAGAAGYSTRYPDRKVVLVDRDPLIAALWRYLIRVTPAEILSIPLIGDDLNVCEEARWLVGFWINKGTAAPVKRPSSRFKSKVRPESHWGETIRQIISGQVDQIKHWRIVEASYADIPNPTTEATWFVDPPYADKGSFYRCPAKDINFEHLGSWCRTLQGQVIVCENAGASWLPFRSFAETRTTQHRKGESTTSVEVVWTNDAPSQTVVPVAGSTSGTKVSP